MEWPASISTCRPLGRNKCFRGGPNISEKLVPGGTNLRGVQIKRDTNKPTGEQESGTGGVTHLHDTGTGCDILIPTPPRSVRVTNVSEREEKRLSLASLAGRPETRLVCSTIDNRARNVLYYLWQYASPPVCISCSFNSEMRIWT